jgi:hypothetical protein
VTSLGGCIQADQEMADFGAQGRIRTTDTRIFSQRFSRLSKSPGEATRLLGNLKEQVKNVAPRKGIEPLFPA